MNITIIGGGNLGSAIASGLLKSGRFKPSDITVTRTRLEKLEDLKQKGVQVSSNNRQAIINTDMIIVAVKPYKMEEVLKELSEVIQPNQIVVSVATGISIARIASMLKKDQSIFRAMPNTAVEIQDSITCYCHHKASEKDIKSVEFVLETIGDCIMINEELMDAATVLGACGIAYVLRFIRAMMQAGIEIGFDSSTAEKIAVQTVSGAASLLKVGGRHPEQEIDKVTTPKGCTISGLNEMEHRGFSSALIKGVLNSFEKINAKT